MQPDDLQRHLHMSTRPRLVSELITQGGGVVIIRIHPFKTFHVGASCLLTKKSLIRIKSNVN